MNAPPSIPRLFAAQGPSLDAHLDAFGELPCRDAELIAAVEESGLSGRGGAGFPTARKMAAVTGRKPVVIANGAEGEPLSRKDLTLLTRAPHLVLDGMAASMAAINADMSFLYVHADAVPAVSVALDQRRAAGLEPHRVEIIEAPDRFVAGEESAAIRCIEGGPALPRDRTTVAAISGVRGRPTLVNNVETMAHIGLIARFGAQWFSSVGEPDSPGTMLVTLSGAVNPSVVEVPTGTSLTRLLDHGGADAATLSAALIGGYHGTWLGADCFADISLSRTGLRSADATPGAGIISALGRHECGLARVAEIAGYLADQSARQCGPCLNGLPRLAELCAELAFGRASDHLVREIRRVAGLVEGRGSCRHPDGTTRMLRSALRVFADDVELHLRRRCSAAVPVR
ncbi:MAG: NADH-ubiquinone oxidoreductase-F iron-sulfur binding region domain-containing protein [Mycobacteriaceae bacterium]